MFLKTESFEHNGVTVTDERYPGTVRFDHQYGGQWL